MRRYMIAQTSFSIMHAHLLIDLEVLIFEYTIVLKIKYISSFAFGNV